MKKLYWVRTIILAGSLLLTTLCLNSRGADHDHFANAQVISGSTGTTNSSNSDATKEPDEPDHAGNAGGGSVWFRWTAPADGQFSFNTGGSAIDTLLAVYTGASLDALNEEASNDDGGIDVTSVVSFPATSGTIYFVAVDGFDGETGDLVLNWAPVLPAANDDFADATEITGSNGNVAGSNFGATKEAGEPDHAGEPGGKSVWFRWTAPASGQYSFDTYGSTIATLLGVYTGVSVNALTVVASNAYAVSFPATVGTTYSVAVDDSDAAGGPLVLNWLLEIPPDNDDFADATEITGLSGNVTGSSSFSTKEPGEPNHAGEPGGRSVWFRWTAPASGQFTFNTAGSFFQPLLAVYTGASVNALTPVTSNDNPGLQFTIEVSFPATVGTTYYLAVDGVSGQAGTLMLKWAPTITVTTGNIFTTLHNFTNGSDGGNPHGDLILSGDTLYGTTRGGGSSGNGTVFKANTDGTGLAILHSFNYSNGSGPFAGLILSGDILYGTTYGGGSSGYGTVFAVNTNGTGFTNLHKFSAPSGPLSTNSDGANPYAGLTISGGTLYGTAWNGGRSGKGTVFAVNTNGTGFTNLHSFSATSGVNSTNTDGAVPSGVLVLSGNVLYGTANSGGNSGFGTVFGLNTDGTGFTTLHHFDWFNGGNPHSAILAGNTLYGTTSGGGGGGGNGTVFAINTDGSGFTTLHNFAGTSGILNTNSIGANPFGGLILSSNILYGTALGGGSSGKGTVFAINTNGTGFTTLHSFSATSGPSATSTNIGGASPRGGLVLSGLTLYGTADRGGNSGYGTLFSLSLEPLRLTIVAAGTNVILTWPLNATGFILQSTTNLVPAAVWSTVSPAPTVVNGQNTVTNPVSGPQKLFRLKLQ